MKPVIWFICALVLMLHCHTTRSQAWIKYQYQTNLKYPDQKSPNADEICQPRNQSEEHETNDVLVRNRSKRGLATASMIAGIISATIDVANLLPKTRDAPFLGGTRSTYILWENYNANKTPFGKYESGTIWEDECLNIRPRFNDKTSAVTLCNWDCIILYEHKNCKDRYSKLVGANEGCLNLWLGIFNDRATSIKGCHRYRPSVDFKPDPETQKKNRVKLWKDEDNGPRGDMYEFELWKDECVNLPSQFDNEVSAIEVCDGSCVILHDYADCRGPTSNPSKLQRNGSGCTIFNFPVFNDRATSVRGC